MKRINKYIKNPREFGIAILTHFFSWLPDKLYLQIRFWLEMGTRLNLKNPQTFQEKLQWLKLYNRKPEYTRMVDKYAVKDYVASIIGEEYVIPTLGVWDRPEEIDFDSLPDKFVLKTTHGGGGGAVVICKDKSILDRNETIQKLSACMRADIFRGYREWPYKNVPRRIIAEKYIETKPEKDLPDYKIFCFNGIPRFFKVDTGRYTEHHANYYDMDWNLLSFDEIPYPHTDKQITIPENFKKMVEIATKLSESHPFIRIDLYNVLGQVFFGEMTFYPASGLGTFSPKQWNIRVGNLLQLTDTKDVVGGGKIYRFIIISEYRIDISFCIDESIIHKNKHAA